MADGSKRTTFSLVLDQARKLLNQGFTVKEATRLIILREDWRPKTDREGYHLTEKDARLGFVKYLIEHGVFSDKGS